MTARSESHAAVLGIDAAWTEASPSGVAFVTEEEDGWVCKGLAPSYSSFAEIARGAAVDWSRPAQGSAPNPHRLLEDAKRLAERRALLVAVDMPMSMVPVRGRREADQAVSKRFGAFGCSVHSPTANRPGTIGAALSRGFQEEGYRLMTTLAGSRTTKCLLEVYPHPALLMLLAENYRIPYKSGKASLEERCRNLERILTALKREIAGINLDLPPHDIGARKVGMKRYEDAIDALVCAWVGMKYLRGQAKPYRDRTAAIWVPTVQGFFPTRPKNAHKTIAKMALE